MTLHNILLVARREFRQVVMLRSFWLTLLLIPAAIAIGPLLRDKLDNDEPTRVIVVDRAGGNAANALEARFAFEQDQRDLQALSRYVRRHKLERADPQAPWAQHDRWYTPADIMAFRKAGGLDAAQAKIDRVKEDGVPEFDAPDRDFEFAEAEGLLANAEGKSFDDEANRLVQADKKAPRAERADIVMLVAEDYPANPTVRVWSNEQPKPAFVASIQDVLTADLRGRLLASSGMSPQQAASVQSAAPAIAVTTPAPGGGAREAMVVRSIVPLALAYLLMMGLMLSGSWMLQGAIEERSKKLLESVLACISAEELMYGKLLGALAIGLSMLAAWLGAAILVAFMTQGAIADMIRPALAPVSSPGAIAALVYFFVAGFIAISILFVGIGALADSMSEAQGYLMPVLLAILLPVTLLIQAILQGNSGPLVQVLTWVPIWTPFTVLARLGSGISTLELVGAAVLMAVFIALEMVMLARLFRASLLAQGQKPSFKLLMERLRPAREV